MGRLVVRKVLAYVVWEGKLLVFRHRDHPEAGLQVPAGTVREGEPVEDAALREAREETGLPGIKVERFLGRYQFDVAPHREETQDRFVFQLGLAIEPPLEWTHDELHDGDHAPTAFCFSWLSLADPQLDELAVGQGALLGRLFSDP